MGAWISIGEPTAAPLTPTQERIKDLLDQGKSIAEIGNILKMRREYLIDEIYEIRKKECTPDMSILTDEQKSQIIELRARGETYKKIASVVGCAPQSCANVWQAHQIRRELDADSDAADMVSVSYDLNQTDNEESDSALPEQPGNVQEKADDLPPYVVRAIRIRLIDIENEIDDRKQRISELEQETVDLVNEYDNLNEWRDRHG